MISNYIQPDLIKISEVLELKKYYPYYKRTIAWYSDLTVCKQVDNIDHIYDMARLKAIRIVFLMKMCENKKRINTFIGINGSAKKLY